MEELNEIYMERTGDKIREEWEKSVDEALKGEKPHIIEAHKAECYFVHWLESSLLTARATIEKLEAWVNDLQSGMYINCVYCGHRYGPREDTPVAMSEVLKQHIEKCPKHPMSKLKGELSEWEEKEAACCPEDVGFDEYIKKLTAEREQLVEALKIAADYFGVFGVKAGKKGPSFGEAGRKCAEALGYSGDSYSNSKWGEPTALPTDEPKREVCVYTFYGDGNFFTTCGYNGKQVKSGTKQPKECPLCNKPIEYIQQKNDQEDEGDNS